MFDDTPEGLAERLRDLMRRAELPGSDPSARVREPADAQTKALIAAISETVMAKVAGFSSNAARLAFLEVRVAL